jgi:hypothetical protein
MTALTQNSAFAHCIEDDWIALKSKVTDTGTCEIKDALNLSSQGWSYPLMSHNPYEVRYWKGSYARTITTETEYLHLILNKCSYHHDTILSEHVNMPREREVTFSVDNPNLHDTVSATYDLAPMTDDEAKSALEKARQECEKYKP